MSLLDLTRKLEGEMMDEKRAEKLWRMAVRSTIQSSAIEGKYVDQSLLTIPSFAERQEMSARLLARLKNNARKP